MLAQFVLFDGFDLLDVVAPFEVLTAGGLAVDGRLQVELVSAEGPRPVPSQPGGVILQATSHIDLERSGLLIVPGAGGKVNGDGPDTVPAILGQALETELTGILRAALAKPGLTVATVCGGALLLALSGLIPQRPAVTHHLGMEVLGATGALPIKARLVDDGDLITAGGVTSGLDLGFYLLERELGPRVAQAIETLFEYERRGTVWQAHGLEPAIP
jgi:transcriptional regulator GlxA family with amidase domain